MPLVAQERSIRSAGYNVVVHAPLILLMVSTLTLFMHYYIIMTRPCSKCHFGVAAEFPTNICHRLSTEEVRDRELGLVYGSVGDAALSLSYPVG